MKKSNFMALILGAVSVMLFALGMCMTLLTEWNTLKPGLIFGVVGLALGLVTIFVWRKMEKKAPVKITGKAVCVIAFSVIGSITLGFGMCFCLVWNKMIVGIITGMVGLIMLLCLIPLVKGIKD